MIPDFDWSSLYYWQRRQALIQFKRRDLPEHTDESDADPLMFLLFAMALSGHAGAVQLDAVATETLWSTARLRRSFLPWARLVGYQLANPAPASADLLGDLVGPVVGAAEVVREGATFATTPAAGASPIVYRLDGDAVTVEDTGAFEIRESDGGVLSTPTYPGQPWSGSGATAVGDALYLGHPTAMFDRIAFELATVDAELVTLCWEYRDDLAVGTPGPVTDLGATVRIDVHDLLTDEGTGRADGALVTVTCLSTGVTEEIAATYTGGRHVVTTSSALGQSVISTDPATYLVSVEWRLLTGQVDGTASAGASWRASGDLRWDLPDGPGRRWAKATIDGVEAFWIRGRVRAVSTARTGCSLDVEEADATTWTARWTVRQGEIAGERLGVSDGSASQAFTLGQGPLIEVEQVTVDGDAWEVRSSFLAAVPGDQVVQLREEADGSWVVTFGDGARGAIPTAGAVLAATYRYGGEADGNVGASVITVDRSGNRRVTNLRNPRQAAGWAAAEGSTPALIEDLRERFPAAVSGLRVAATPDDLSALATAFRSAAGAQVAERAVVVEEGAGPKTVLVVCAGPGGAIPAPEDLAELDAYLNGTVVGVTRVGGVVIGNVRAVVVPYSPRAIAVTVSIEVLRGYGEVAEDAARTALQAYLSPGARRLERQADGSLVEGAAFQWTMGGEIRRSQIVARIATSVEGFADLTLTTPAANVTLGDRELPVPGALSISVTEVDL